MRCLRVAEVGVDAGVDADINADVDVDVDTGGEACAGQSRVKSVG